MIFDTSGLRPGQSNPLGTTSAETNRPQWA